MAAEDYLPDGWEAELGSSQDKRKRIMSQIWSPHPIEVYKDWISAILDESSNELNDWETKFIESIGTRLMNDNNLTELQANKLESIYCEKTK